MSLGGRGSIRFNYFLGSIKEITNELVSMKKRATTRTTFWERERSTKLLSWMKGAITRNVLLEERSDPGLLSGRKRATTYKLNFFMGCIREESSDYFLCLGGRERLPLTTFRNNFLRRCWTIFCEKEKKHRTAFE